MGMVSVDQVDDVRADVQGADRQAIQLGAEVRLAKRFTAGFVLRNTVAPTIVGTPQQGQALTADPGHWAGAPGSFTYQWNRCAAGGGCTAIAGAVGQTYAPTAADAGSTLTVTVTASNSVSQSTATSAAVGPVP
jgi:hypothetical protein